MLPDQEESLESQQPSKEKARGDFEEHVPLHDLAASQHRIERLLSKFAVEQQAAKGSLDSIQLSIASLAEQLAVLPPYNNNHAGLQAQAHFTRDAKPMPTVLGPKPMKVSPGSCLMSCGKEQDLMVEHEEVTAVDPQEAVNQHHLPPSPVHISGTTPRGTSPTRLEYVDDEPHRAVSSSSRAVSKQMTEMRHTPTENRHVSFNHRRTSNELAAQRWRTDVTDDSSGNNRERENEGNGAQYPNWLAGSSPRLEFETNTSEVHIAQEMWMVHSLTAELPMSIGEGDDRRPRLLWAQSSTFGICEYYDKKFFVEPNSPFRLFVDTFSMVILFFDLTLTPYVLAWQVDISGLLLIYTCCSVAWWIFDFLMNFRTGFYRDGTLVSDRSLIARRYMRSFMIPDLITILVDIISVVIQLMTLNTSSTTQTVKVLRFAKAGRILRVVGAMRMAHLSEWVERITDGTAFFHTSGFLFDICTIFFLIIWLNHVISCAWYAVGKLGTTDTGATWLDGTSASDISYEDAGFWYQYTTAFHWSLTQMTPGSMQVHPVNSIERGFTICCLIFGLLVFSSLVSSISAKLTNLKLRMQHQTSQLETWRRFLVRNKITSNLAVRLLQQLRGRMNIRKPLVLRNVPGIELLSLSLHNELQFELCQHHVSQHCFFQTLLQIDGHGVMELCGAAAELGFLRSGDRLFTPGQEAESVYFMISGRLQYRVHRGPLSRQQVLSKRTSEDDNAELVEETAWISEVAFWCNWRHMGIAEACLECELMVLNVRRFVEFVVRHDTMKAFAWEYSRSFHLQLVETSSNEALKVSDVFIPFQAEEVVESMSLTGRTVFGMAALKVLRPGGWSLIAARIDKPKLEREIKSGTSALLLTGRGLEVRRMTTVMALSLRHQDGRLLVQLGKLYDGQLMVTCTLPGTKQVEDERPLESLQRLLQTDLMPMEDLITQEGMEKRTECRRSVKYGIETKYTRIVMCATLRPGCSLDDLGVPKAYHKEDDRDLPQHDVYIMGEQRERRLLYAWLDESEYEHFASAAGAPLLNRWVSNLEADEDVIASPRMSRHQQTFQSSRAETPMSLIATALMTKLRIGD